MRFMVTLAALLAASSAGAAPAVVTVQLGSELQDKANKTLGMREVSRLADDLKSTVERELARAGALSDARVELTLTDAQPNRPTFKQMGDRPGLSFESFGVGGAAIEGRIVSPDGSAVPLTYKWYETDISQVWGYSPWWDAETTFSRFARKLAKGERLASR